MPEGLAAELLAIFRGGLDSNFDEIDFDRVARRVFAQQFRTNRVYRSLCQRRGIDPAGVAHWTEIPAVPAAAFRSFPMLSGAMGDVQRTFRTSGTTGDRGTRGEHHVLDLRLYRESLLPNFRAHVLPDEARLLLLSLVPPSPLVRDSSLSFMIDVIATELVTGARYFADPERGLDGDAFRAALREAEQDGQPLLLVGTAFAFVHWLDECKEIDWRVRLPQGSRIMETGGFKGRSRTVTREWLHGELCRVTAIPQGFMVNEYGMTELLSQCYDPVLRRGRDAESERYHVGPPWMRTRILDPLTLEPVATGEVGILCHYDLANAGSVLAVLTEDRGRAAEEGFHLLDRTSGAPPRGCSLAMDDLIQAVGT